MIAAPTSPFFSIWGKKMGKEKFGKENGKRKIWEKKMGKENGKNLGKENGKRKFVILFPILV
jgi:hypothetical protein